MGAVWLLGAVSATFIIMGIFLCCGKGSWLIAGYNTASKGDKDKYDQKKMCKATGILCIVIGICLIGLAVLGYRVEQGLMEEQAMGPYAIAFCVIIFSAVGIDLYYINNKCKK